MYKQQVKNWGLYPTVEAEVFKSDQTDEIVSIVNDIPEALIARGNGRCYGDSSLGQNIFETSRLNKFLSFDKSNGILHCQSGVLLSEILEVIVPQGYFLPVTPGTKFITVGGAIGADVHGKNHHVEGCFSDHVLFLDIITADGHLVRCSQTENAHLFWETCGGMGLSGIVISAAIKLKEIHNSYIDQKIIKAGNLKEIMQLFEAHKESPYSVAWIDCLQKKHIGRSHLIVGNHAAPNDNLGFDLSKKKQLNIPFMFPSFALNKYSVKAFNFSYYHKQISKIKANTVHYEGFFYPLDSLLNWNRIYGKSGFTQYQFVLPLDASEEGLKVILKTIAESGEGSFLAVLKLFGRANPNAIMSFPIKGYTLALDFKINPLVLRLLDKLDEIVAHYGGHLYLAKDARMKPDFFHSSYGKKIKTCSKFQSLQSARLKI